MSNTTVRPRKPSILLILGALLGWLVSMVVLFFDWAGSQKCVESAWQILGCREKAGFKLQDFAAISFSVFMTGFLTLMFIRRLKAE